MQLKFRAKNTEGASNSAADTTDFVPYILHLIILKKEYELYLTKMLIRIFYGDIGKIRLWNFIEPFCLVSICSNLHKFDT